jgi:hypothetical protein
MGVPAIRAMLPIMVFAVFWRAVIRSNRAREQTVCEIQKPLVD